MNAWALAAVFAGGSIGSLAREIAVPLLPAPWIWTPILIVNVGASFLLGMIYAARARLHAQVVVFGAVGFCGGFSTFSHLARETRELLAAGALGEVAASVGLSVVLGILAAVLGERLARPPT